MAARRSVSAAAAIVAGAVLACTSADNLGPVPDEDLNSPEAREGLLNGMERALSVALNLVALTGASVARELAPSGAGSGSFGWSDVQQAGILDPGLSEADQHWGAAQQARWVAEDGVRRLRLVLGEGFGGSPDAARGLLFAGFANRLLGENMCDAVVDGGGVQPRRVSFERAEAAFTEALAIAAGLGDAELELAARAGRASTRVGLGDWPAATADAALVPTGFVHRARTSAIELSQYNRIYWANAKQPLRLHTVWSTFYEGYFAETRDPRTPWTTDPEFPTTRNGDPWLLQAKHAERGSPINLVTGREMRLIEAEALLRAGDAGGALAIVNGLRAESGVAPREAATLDEAWVALKRERGIELWLEGRRLWDLHRWIEEGTPGAVEDMTGRSTCFPIGRTEVDANPNVDRR
jgi:hypothetical protein